MTDKNAPVRKHLATAKEHAAGVKANREWVHDLAAKGLLRTQTPIGEQPATPAEGETK